MSTRAYSIGVQHAEHAAGIALRAGATAAAAAVTVFGRLVCNRLVPAVLVRVGH